jgi:uncharacterized protein YgfB (UPF0149 family)
MTDESKSCIRIDVCADASAELHGVLVGRDGVSHPFTGWLQLVSALEEERQPPGGRSARVR